MLSELHRFGLRASAVRRSASGAPLLIAMPQRVEAMEQAAPALWAALRRVTVTQLKMLEPSGEFRGLVDALIAVRELMGGEGSC